MDIIVPNKHPLKDAVEEIVSILSEHGITVGEMEVVFELVSKRVSQQPILIQLDR